MTDYKEYFIHENCVALKSKPVDRTLFNNYDYACLLVNDCRGLILDVEDLEKNYFEKLTSVEDFVRGQEYNNYLKDLIESNRLTESAGQIVKANIELGSFLEEMGLSELEIYRLTNHMNDVDNLNELVELRVKYLDSNDRLYNKE